MFTSLKAGAAAHGRWPGFLGRDPHPSAAGKDVLHIKAPGFSAYRFEWHPKSRKVYLVRLGVTPLQGEVMAFDIETHGEAINAVLIWSRGYREGQTPTLIKAHLTE